MPGFPDWLRAALISPGSSLHNDIDIGRVRFIPISGCNIQSAAGGLITAHGPSVLKFSWHTRPGEKP
jgi:hypothetical protein